jgi:hypothetical protein
MITLEEDRLHAVTRTLDATFHQGVLVSLIRRRDGKTLISQDSSGFRALQLIFMRDEMIQLGGESRDTVVPLLLNDHRAEIRFHSWHGDGILAVSEDVESGDLIVEPSGYSSRPGLRSVRWAVSGIAPGLDLVAPLYQGVRLALEDKHIASTKFRWPHEWEAGLAILQGEDGGFAIHCRDTHSRYKALQVGLWTGEVRALGLETEAYGPIDDNLSAGGLEWRLSVHDGDWKQPAGIYRDWLERTWRPGDRQRPDWVQKLRFAVSWCPLDDSILQEIAKVLPPAGVLLHVPDWRSDPYDENYPHFQASEKGRTFIKKAQSMGFRVMPHFNSIDMDPTHPAYTYVRDFGYRELENKRLLGWTWDNGLKFVQESNAARLLYRDKKSMVKIHPGLAMYRSIMAENVGEAVKDLDLEATFLDVTLTTANLFNCLVENQTSTEGMNRLIDHVASVRRGLAMGGEGRNEMTMQTQSLGQPHLFKSWHDNIEGLERCGGTALNEFMFGRWCRSFGYGAHGVNAEMRMDMHVALGAIPTVSVNSGAEISSPNAGIKKMLDAAK